MLKILPTPIIKIILLYANEFDKLIFLNIDRPAIKNFIKETVNSELYKWDYLYKKYPEQFKLYKGYIMNAKSKEVVDKYIDKVKQNFYFAGIYNPYNNIQAFKKLNIPEYIYTPENLKFINNLSTFNCLDYSLINNMELLCYITDNFNNIDHRILCSVKKKLLFNMADATNLEINKLEILYRILFSNKIYKYPALYARIKIDHKILIIQEFFSIRFRLKRTKKTENLIKYHIKNIMGRFFKRAKIEILAIEFFKFLKIRGIEIDYNLLINSKYKYLTVWAVNNATNLNINANLYLSAPKYAIEQGKKNINSLLYSEDINILLYALNSGATKYEILFETCSEEKLRLGYKFISLKAKKKKYRRIPICNIKNLLMKDIDILNFHISCKGVEFDLLNIMRDPQLFKYCIQKIKNINYIHKYLRFATNLTIEKLIICIEHIGYDKFDYNILYGKYCNYILKLAPIIPNFDINKIKDISSVSISKCIKMGLTNYNLILKTTNNHKIAYIAIKNGATEYNKIINTIEMILLYAKYK